ncbi:hypothetical protein [Pseudomonas sp. zfem002]|uniref:hypothetical protein n=1 Tax=Pseudomonas sp. zfem002 TaxID=3078197 RepID=UPI002928A1D2|nr:hypothetical protein [Pseudomonas sp. zfem002]MDU9393136.1 hypothetical protein [Pseudomonas sp. zfem002]
MNYLKSPLDNDHTSLPKRIAAGILLPPVMAMVTIKSNELITATEQVVADLGISHALPYVVACICVFVITRAFEGIALTLYRAYKLF